MRTAITAKGMIDFLSNYPPSYKLYAEWDGQRMPITLIDAVVESDDKSENGLIEFDVNDFGRGVELTYLP